MNFKWKEQVPFINLAPVPAIEFKPLSASLPVIGSDEVGENYIILWLIVITFVLGYLKIVPVLKQCRADGFKMSP